MRCDHFSPDVCELLALLASHRVRYLVVGGEAVIFHGHVRLTGDVDLFYDSAPENVARLFAALVDFWEGDVPGIAGPEQLEQPGLVVQFGCPPNRVDLLSSIDAVSFDDAWRNRVTVGIETASSVVDVHYIGLEELLRNKRATGRHKDREDVEVLTPE